MEGQAVSASWYDGLSAVRRDGTAWLDETGSLVLRDRAGNSETVPPGDLVYGESLQAETVYKRESVPDFRLRLPRDLPPALASALPAPTRYGRWIDRIGLGKAAIAFAAASAGCVALFDRSRMAGPDGPPAWNGRWQCDGGRSEQDHHAPEGDAALAKLLDAVDPETEKVRAGIANMGMINAVALPGGQVLLFDGLVQQAETPEELAGVLGHEVGHVRERHVMTSILRQFGLSILLAGSNSGVGNTAFGVASLGYSREAEREADEYARARMAQSNISPLGAAAFFERLGGGGDEEDRDEDTSGDNDESGLIGWIASHPAPGERAKAYRDSVRQNAEYRPVLTQAEFAALKTMCDQDEDVEEFEFF